MHKELGVPVFDKDAIPDPDGLPGLGNIALGIAAAALVGSVVFAVTVLRRLFGFRNA